MCEMDISLTIECIQRDIKKPNNYEYFFNL